MITQNLNKTQDRNFVKLKMNNFKVKLQLDTGRDITIIKEKTCKNIGVPTLTITKKVARGIPGKEIYFRSEIACDLSCPD